MNRLVIVAAASVGLILFLTFVLGRLLRSRRRGLSIRMQIFLALAGIIGAFAFGLGLLVIDRVEARAVRLAEAAAREEAQALAGLLAAELERTGVSLVVVAEQLADVASRPVGGPAVRPRIPPLARPPETPEPAGFELFDASGRQLYPKGRRSLAEEPGALTVTVELTVERKLVGLVRVVKPTIVLKAMLADFAPTVLVISLILGAAAALSAAWIGGTIAEPMEALSEFAERVSEGERTPLPARATGREVLRLVRSIDTMQRKLEGRPFVETFAADLSHELKNPVAAIRASAEVLLEGALDEPAQAEKFVARILEASARIERLLEELLSLARVESRGTETLEWVALRPLCQDAARHLGLDAQRLTLRLDPSARVRADAFWLARAVSNLLENGILHSPEGSPLSLETKVVGANVVLTIENEGAIAEHLRATLFRRFVTTRRSEGGTGLGLSIVRAVAEAHGGRVEFRSFGPGRVRVELSLPRA